jgi:hypothetical protein
MVGVIMGSCKTVSLTKPDDYARYLSIYYTSKKVTGLKLATDLGDTLIIGQVASSGLNLKTFTFDKKSLLVGFFGSRTSSQINSLGVIHLDSKCLKAPAATTTAITQPAPILVTIPPVADS